MRVGAEGGIDGDPVAPAVRPRARRVDAGGSARVDVAAVALGAHPIDVGYYSPFPISICIRCESSRRASASCPTSTVLSMFRDAGPSRRGTTRRGPRLSRGRSGGGSTRRWRTTSPGWVARRRPAGQTSHRRSVQPARPHVGADDLDLPAPLLSCRSHSSRMVYF